MDPITTAIVAALASGAVSGVTKVVVEHTVSDAYSKLKELLKKKFGARSKVVTAVKALEASPKSDARKAVVKEEVVAAKADKDAELVRAAQALLKVIKAQPGGEQIVQMAMGDQNIQIAGDGNVVSVNTPKTRR